MVLRLKSGIFSTTALETILALTKWYVDGGVSGVEEERPELDKILFDDEQVGQSPPFRRL